MRKTSVPFILVLSFFIAPCIAAEDDAPHPEVANAPEAALNQPGRLLKAARDQQAKDGCAKAAPTYRVVASFGEGYEVAQYELGACLLQLSAEGDAEARLFLTEGLFWLERSAWAGNARAQGALAEALSGAPNRQAKGVTARPEEAMGWALVYADNAERDLYNLPKLDTDILSHLSGVLSESALRSAEDFAKHFQELDMAGFVAPQLESPQNQPQRRLRQMRGGERRR